MVIICVAFLWWAHSVSWPSTHSSLIATITLLGSLLLGSSLILSPFAPLASTAVLLITIVMMWSWQQTQSRSSLAVVLILVPALTLDSPWGRAFNTTDPFTESLGTIFFSPLHTSLGLSGISITAFELVSLILALSLAYRDLSKPGLHKITWPAALIIFSIPLAVSIGMAVGLANSHPLSLMFTQVRSIASLPLWAYVGFRVIQEDHVLQHFLDVVLLCVAAKCIQALWIYRQDYSGSMGKWEFLVEHSFSEFIVSAGLWLLHRLWVYRSKILMTFLPGIGLMLLFAYVFALNDRRASVVGAALSVAIIPFAAPRQLRPSIFAATFAAGLVVSGFLLATWNSQGTIGRPAMAVKSLISDDGDSSLDYRDAENANLLSAVADAPLTGMGFGTRFPIRVPMVNISSVYKDYDLIPHNTLLYLWAYGGPISMGLLALFGVFSLTTSIRYARSSSNFSGFFVGVFVGMLVIRWLVNTMADLGLTEVRYLMLVGLTTGGIVGLYYRNQQLQGDTP